TKQTPGETVVPSCSSDPGHDTDAIGIQDPPAFGERMVPDKVINQIVSLIGLGEIFFRVVDHVICPDRADHLEISRATHAGHLRPTRFRYLHRKGANTSRRAIDQDLLASLNFSSIAKTLQSGDGRDG